MEKKSEMRDLTQGDVFKTLVIFSLPFMLSTVLQTLYSTVDMMIVGNVVGKDGLSALSTGSQLMEMIAVVCVGFSSAGQVLISNYVGARQKKEVQKINSTLTFLMVLLALVITVIGVAGCDTFLKLLNTPQEALPHARQYVIICCLGILFTGLYNMVSAIFRGMGDSRHPLIFIAIASGVNVVLDLLFVCVFRLGAAGAAIATVIGQAVSVICSLTFLNRKKEEYCFSFRPSEFKVDGKVAAALCRLGIPMALQTSAVYISFLFVSSMINAMGVVVSAAFGASQKIRNMPNMMTQAIGLGATAMMGQNFGAGKMDRVRKIYLSGCKINAVFGVLFAVIYGLFPVRVFQLFTGDAQVLEYAGMCIFCILLEIPAKIFMPSGSALINGNGNVKLSMALALSDAFVGRIFLTWFLGKVMGFGVSGYFLGYCLATYVTAVPQVIYYLSGRWKKQRRLI